jgi:hypothetical protein
MAAVQWREDPSLWVREANRSSTRVGLFGHLAGFHPLRKPAIRILLTREGLNAALQKLQCEVGVMDELVAGILRTLGQEMHPDFLEASRAKVARYIETLASTGKRDPAQLTIYGRAYLKELQKPNPRYSGC